MLAVNDHMQKHITLTFPQLLLAALCRLAIKF